MSDGEGVGLMIDTTALVQEASDPATAPERLAALANERQAEVRSAVASNPNAPAEALVQLIGRVGGETVTENPALPLLLMADPLFLRRLSLEARRWLARQRLPRIVCEALLTEGAMVREVIARHQPLDDELARELVATLTPTSDARGGTGARLVDEALADALASNETTPGWAVLVAARAVGLRRKPVHGGVTLTSVLEAMAGSADPLVRAMAAADTRASEELLERLAADENTLVRRAVAGNSSTSEAMLETMANDANAHVRQSLGRNPRAPRWVLRKLARDPSEFVRDRPRQRLKAHGSGW